MERMLTLHELTLGIQLVLILVFLFILILLIYSFKKYKTEANRQVWKDKIDKYLMEVIVDGKPNDISISEELISLCKRESFRRFFLSQLIGSERKFSGAAAAVLKSVFYTYNLDKEAYVLLRSNQSYLIARGIQALTIMNVMDALPEIKTKLNHHSNLVIREVQYSLVHFLGFEGLAFLNNTSILISDWQQLRLLNSIKSLPIGANVNIKSWLYSGNVSTKLFALKLIRKFQVFEIHDELIAFLENVIIQVQTETVKTLFTIESGETTSLLVNNFQKFAEKTQIEIIKGLGKNRALDQIDFLKSQLEYHPIKQIKVHAAEALSLLGEENYLIGLSRNLDDADPTLLVLNHALQTRL